MANSGGLGIAAFLKHSSDDAGRGKWVRQWNKNQAGDLVFWLHTRAPIVPTFTHQFMLEDEYADKETGKRQAILRFLRFNSPDVEVVHRNQYFREDDQTLQVKPNLDPFLLLREWLRFADHLALDQPIFQWTDPKKRQIITWQRGVIAGLEKRGRSDFGHSLDTKLEYVFVVVDNDHMDAGPVLCRFGKLPAQRIQEIISQQREQWGEEAGDPLQHPYALHMQMKDAKSPMDVYKCWKEEKATFTDQVWEQISGEQYPDPSPHGQMSDGDQQKIRDAFEAAAQVELPLDAIFSEDPDERARLCRPQLSARPPARQSKAAQQKAAPPPPVAAKPAQQKAAPPPPVAAKPAGTVATKPATTAPAPAAGPTARRRKKEPEPVVEPEPEEPEAETIPCDECKVPMLATATKCPSCGAEYEVEEADTPPPKPVAAKPAISKPAATTKPKPVSSPKPAPAAAVVEDALERDPADCWACGVALSGAEICPSCGIDQNENLPF